MEFKIRQALKTIAIHFSVTKVLDWEEAVRHGMMDSSKF